MGYDELSKKIDDLAKSTTTRFGNVNRRLRQLSEDIKPFKTFLTERGIEDRVISRLSDKNIQSQINKGSVSIPREVWKFILLIVGIIGTLAFIIQALIGAN